MLVDRWEDAGSAGQAVPRSASPSVVRLPASEPFPAPPSVAPPRPSSGRAGGDRRWAVQQAAKRLLDVLASLVLLALLAPTFLLIALAVKVTSRGPVLFRQVRVGRGGRPFVMYKFRSMIADAERRVIDLRDRNDADGPLLKLRQDPRVTPVGRVLRRLCIDEFPQLVNVVKGEMSIVGPRPFVPDESTEFTEWAARRFDVRPGMTGRWQVSGCNNLPFEELKRLDHEYVSRWSLWRDIQIVLRTPLSIARRRGSF